jgi:hypothetical protein
LNNFGILNKPSPFFKKIWAGVPLYFNKCVHHPDPRTKKQKERRRRLEKVTLIPKVPIPSFRKQFDS